MNKEKDNEESQRGQRQCQYMLNYKIISFALSCAECVDVYFYSNNVHVPLSHVRKPYEKQVLFGSHC